MYVYGQSRVQLSKTTVAVHNPYHIRPATSIVWPFRSQSSRRKTTGRFLQDKVYKVYEKTNMITHTQHSTEQLSNTTLGSRFWYNFCINFVETIKGVASCMAVKVCCMAHSTTCVGNSGGARIRLWYTWNDIISILVYRQRREFEEAARAKAARERADELRKEHNYKSHLELASQRRFQSLSRSFVFSYFTYVPPSRPKGEKKGKRTRQKPPRKK